MNNANKISCEIIIKPNDKKYSENIREFQGCPTIAVTHGGRIYAGWYAGGTGEPHMENYNLLVFSDDGGKTWTEPYLVIPSSHKNFVHASDIQLWTDTDGKLHLSWMQHNVKPAPEKLGEYPAGQIAVVADGYLFDDFTHAAWEIVCDEPDAAEPIFSQPRNLFDGFLRTKPITLKNDTLIYSVYNQIENNLVYQISYDKGKTFKRIKGSEKLPAWCDEPMSYQLNDGSIRTLSRRKPVLTETFSFDNGLTWTKAAESDIPNPESRIFVGRTNGGRVLLVGNDSSEIRNNMSIAVSEDDGKTWKNKICIDAREWTSYPDVDFYGDRIYIIYDRERVDAKEILFLSVTEEEIINGSELPSPTIISKPVNTL